MWSICSWHITTRRTEKKMMNKKEGNEKLATILASRWELFQPLWPPPPPSSQVRHCNDQVLLLPLQLFSISTRPKTLVYFAIVAILLVRLSFFFPIAFYPHKRRWWAGRRQFDRRTFRLFFYFCNWQANCESFVCLFFKFHFSFFFHWESRASLTDCFRRAPSRLIDFETIIKAK